MSVEVRARALSKSYRDGERRVEVLRGAELTVEAGELVAVVGPSGSGKSTLLHLLGTLDRPDSGSIEIGGQDVARLAGARLAAFRNRTIGFVFQFHQLLPDFDALENVMLPGRIAGRDAAGVEARAHLVARATGRIAGVGPALRVFELVDPRVETGALEVDGAAVAAGTIIASVRGPARAILAGERVALNLLGHLSGVATATRALVDRVEGTGAKILDTRKTSPLWRARANSAAVCIVSSTVIFFTSRPSPDSTSFADASTRLPSAVSVRTFASGTPSTPFTSSSGSFTTSRSQRTAARISGGRTCPSTSESSSASVRSSNSRPFTGHDSAAQSFWSS